MVISSNSNMASGDGYHSHDEEEDLNAAIAESLLSFNNENTGDGDENNKGWGNDLNETNDNTAVASQEGNDDFDLENTIGQVFQQYFTPAEKEALAGKEQEQRGDKSKNTQGSGSLESTEDKSSLGQDSVVSGSAVVDGQSITYYASSDEKANAENSQTNINKQENREDSTELSHTDEGSKEEAATDLELAISRAFSTALEDDVNLSSKESENQVSDVTKEHQQNPKSLGDGKQLVESNEVNEEAGISDSNDPPRKDISSGTSLSSGTQKDSHNSSLTPHSADKNSLTQSIENAFKKVTNDGSEHMDIVEDEKSDTEANNLEKAIGDAFFSLQKETHDTPKSHSLNIVSRSINSESLSSYNPTESSKTSAGSIDDSEGKQKEPIRTEVPESDNSKVDLSNIIQTILSQMNTSDENSSAFNTSQLPISESNLKELALEITNQVQDHMETDYRKPSAPISDLPQIDENVLAHFQNEANKDEPSYSQKATSEVSKEQEDAAIHSAIANVVKSAIDSAPSAAASHTADLHEKDDDNSRKDTDLDSLEMNTILQNAFNMAMENPQVLLSQLEGDEEDGQKEHNLGSTEPHLLRQEAPKKFNYPLPSSTASFLQSLKRSNDIHLGDSTTNKLVEGVSNLKRDALSQNDNHSQLSTQRSTDEEGKKKALSIAETLALHRASMSNFPRRDYSSINNLKDITHSIRQPSSSPLVSRLSNVISSLSSKISSTSSGGDNVLSVIRQMTHALTTNKTPSTLLGDDFTTLNEMLGRMKGSDDERLVLNAVYVAKAHFKFKRSVIHVEAKIFTLLDFIISSFDESFRSPEIESGIEKIHDLHRDFISNVSDQVYNTVSNTFTNKYKSSFFMGERPKADTPEYKERIRLENRERKKRWREENIERNKDNDLRSRVIKRANLIFGEVDSAEKKSWIEDEFTRRRSKRLAKQKKEEEEKQNKGLIGKNLTVDKVRYSVDLASFDPNIVKLVSYVYDVVSCCVKNENSEIALPLVAVSMVSALVVSLDTCQDDEKKDSIKDGASSLVLSILDKSKFLNLQDKSVLTSKGIYSALTPAIPAPHNIDDESTSSEFSAGRISSLLKMKSGSASGILSRLSSTIKTLSPSTSDSTNLYENSKMPSKDSKDQFPNYESPNKRQKLDLSKDSNDSTTLVSSTSNVQDLTDNLPQSQDSILSLSNNNAWKTTTSLRMPSYKKPVSSKVKLELSSEIDDNVPSFGLSIPNHSPFISHKVTTSNSIPKKQSTLRKPGSFQRPGVYRNYDAKIKNTE